MARPNRVFFLCSEYNNLKTILPSTTSEYIDFLIKALVSGFGPYPIVSLVIFNNVATVTLDEEVTIHPGVKLDIRGTGVAALDGMQEIESINNNTFTFKVESPNATFTNGITYSYLSLGWSLLFRSNDAVVLKSGNSGSSEHCVLLKLWPNTLLPGAPSYRLEVLHIKNPISISVFEDTSPIPLYKNFTSSLNVQLQTVDVPILGINWFYYGDDVFVLAGYSGNTSVYTNFFSQTDRIVGNTFSFGELKRTPVNTNSFFMSGDGYNIYNSDYINSSLLYNAEDTPSFSNINKMWVHSRGNEMLSFCLPAATVCYGHYVNKTGNKAYNNSSQRIQTNIQYMGLFIKDIENRVHGWIPGLYFLMRQPNMRSIKENLKILYPLKVKGSLQNRKCYAIFGATGSQAQHITSSTPDNMSVAMLDLTGPIR